MVGQLVLRELHTADLWPRSVLIKWKLCKLSDGALPVEQLPHPDKLQHMQCGTLHCQLQHRQ